MNWQTPHATLAFFSLMMAFISLWVKRSPWVWGAFLLLAYSLAYFAGLIAPIAFAPIAGLLVGHAILKSEVKGLLRFLFFLAVTALSFGLLFHFFPGFKQLDLVKNAHVSPGAYPYTLSLFLDKPMVGLFILAWSFPLIQNLKAFEKLLKMTLPFALLSIVFMALLAYYTGLIRFDPKLPSFLWIFLPINLIFVCVVEEAFFRGFLQTELFRFFGNKGFFAAAFAILLTASVMAAGHYFWVPNIPFLALVFVASVLYGTIYQITGAIESSILTHFLFNAAHITLFTYPAFIKTLAV